MDILSGFLYVICAAVRLLLFAIYLSVGIDALLSFFVEDDGVWYVRLFAALAAPALFPFRALFARFHWFENLPVDLSPLFAMVTLSILLGLLPAIPY